MRVQVFDAGDVEVYDQTVSAIASTQVDDWYSYFYGEFDQSSEQIFLDQPGAEDLPGYQGYRIDITITRTGGTAKVGQIVMGRLLTIGKAVEGTRVGSQDFSIKAQDDFGRATLNVRGFSREVDYEVVIPTLGAQRIAKIMDDLRATPIVFLAGKDANGAALGTVVFGIWDDYQLNLRPVDSTAIISVKGLVYRGVKALQL